MSERASDLHAEVIEILDTIEAARRRLASVRNRYAVIDPAVLEVDELGPALSPESVVENAQGELQNLNAALSGAVDATYSAMRFTSRLRG